MQITLIENESIVTINLPEKINGQYWVERTSPLSEKEKVFSIEADTSQWVLKAGRNSYILDENLEEQREKTLVVDDYIPVGFRRTGERAHLLITELQASDLLFRKLVVPPNSRFVVGSDASADICINSPLISGGHCEFQFKDNVFTINALSPGSPVYVNEERTESQVLLPGDVVFLMGTSLIVGENFVAVNRSSNLQSINSQYFSDFSVQVAYSEVEEGFFDDDQIESIFFRSPRFKRDIHTYQLELDAPPGKGSEEETPAILTIGPAMTMAMSSVVTATFSVANNLSAGGSISSTIPTLAMSSTMLLGSLLWPTLSRRYSKKKQEKDEKIRKKKYYAYLEKVRAELENQSEIQAEILRENYVSLPSCVERIEKQQRNLWERMPEHGDFLDVRIGTGNLPLDINFGFREEGFSVEEDELKDAMNLLGREPREVKEVPIPHSLVESFITGVTGERKETDLFVRNMILQLVSLHSYMDLKIVFLYDEEEEDKWGWVRWLPHVWDDSQSIRFVASNMDELKVVTAHLEQLINQLTEGSSTATMSPTRYVIVSTDRELGKKAEMMNQILEMNQYLGFSLVLEYNDLRFLPKECNTVIEVNGKESKVFNRHDISGWSQPFYPEYHADISADDVAVMLSNIKLDQADKAFALPTTMTFLEMFQVEKIEHLNPLERWKNNNPVNSLQAPIGITTRGDYFNLDLHEKYHGPHGLIAGMTGSGKSELIMTYILSLALNYHPNEVAFILIDYKGGGMANAFTHLPHLAGTITNLDGAAITRSLVSIESELKRRQAIFSSASEQVDISNIDIYKYQKLYREGIVKEPLQHLFIISDEFAELKTQQPEFMEQLVSAARIGRSLGVHLILATQKPSGVVDDQIWSNSRFRISLKVQDEADSNDVLKKPVAAALVEAGRFYVQVGFDEIFELGQSAWAGAPYLPDGNTLETVDDKVVFIDKLGRPVREFSPSQMQEKEVTREANPPKQLDEITKYLATLAKEEGIKVRSLWLEPIEPVIYVQALEEKYAYQAEEFTLLPVIGEYDNPAKQSQALLTFDIAGSGNTILYGAAGSGKSIFLVTLVHSLLKDHTAEEVNIYILDFESETLRCFIDAPQVGDVAFLSEEEKVNNLFRMLSDLLEERKKLYVDSGGSYESYLESGETAPRVVLILHNYSVFEETYEDLAYEDFVQLTRDCTKYGLHVIVTTNSVSAVRYRTAQNFASAISLELNDPTDYRSIFNTTDRIVPASHAGRGLCQLDNLYEFQTAYITEPQKIYSHAREFSKELALGYTGAPAPHIPILPEICDSAYMEQFLDSSPAIPIGVDVNTLAIATSTFPNFINPIVWDIADGSFMLQGVAELFHKKGYDITVLDPEETFYGTPEYPYYTSYQEVKSEIEEFVLTLHQRHTAYKEHIEHQTSYPEYEEKIYFINNMSSILAMLDSAEQQNVELSLEHGRVEYNMRIVLGLTDFRGHTTNTWFSEQVSNDSLIWVGYGMGDDYAVRVTSNTREVDENIPDNFGYILERGKPRRCMLVLAEGYDPEGEE